MICPYSWWLQCLWLCQEHVLWWGTLVRLCFANKFISSFYGFRHHSSFYKQGGDPCEDEMDISGDSPNERCLQKNKSPWSSEFCLTDTRVHTHAHSFSYLRLSLFYIISQRMQYIYSVPTQALPPLNHGSCFLLTFGNLTKSDSFLLFLSRFSGVFYCSQPKTRAYGKTIEMKERQHPPLKNTAFTVIAKQNPSVCSYSMC